jgi:predicted transglutaminase-like cysteine proteinase
LTTDRFVSSPPSPNILVAIGHFAIQSAAQAEIIYLRGDARRQLVSYSLAMVPDENGNPKLFPLPGPGKEHDVSCATAIDETPSGWIETRRNAYQAAIRNAPDLLSRLQQIQYDLLAHEKLMSAGWQEARNLSLNFFLLADAGDPWAAGVLLPTCAIVQKMAFEIGLARIHLLLNTAVFPNLDLETGYERSLGIYTLLLDLDDLLQANSSHRSQLFDAINFPGQPPVGLSAYLFDCHKDGTAVVKDEASLSVLFGNALLAMLEADMAQRLFLRNSDFDPQERNCFYNSIGAAAILYDPASLEETCASRLAGEFLRQEIIGRMPDKQASNHQAELILENLGKTWAWPTRLLSGLPANIGRVAIHSETLKFDFTSASLPAMQLDYLNMSATPWAQQLIESRNYFHQTAISEYREKLDVEASELRREISSALQNFIQDLPLKAELYPGGIQAGLEVLNRVEEELQNRDKVIKKIQFDLDKRLPALDAELDGHLKAIQAIFQAAPDLPWFIQWQPMYLREKIAPLYYGLRYGKQILRAQAHRDIALKLLNEFFAVELEQMVLQALAPVLDTLLDQIHKGQQEIASLLSKLLQLTEQLPEAWPNFPLDKERNGWDAFYRRPALDESLAHWAYERWHPQLHSWIAPFLDGQGPLAGWQILDIEKLGDWMKERGRLTYHKVWQISLDDIFAMWLERRPGFEANEFLTTRFLQEAAQAALPPLHPDFDASGGSQVSGWSNYALVSDPHWHYCKFEGDEKHWEIVYTGDPFAAVFMQVQHAVPLAALVSMTRSGRIQYESFSDEAKSACSLLALPPSETSSDGTDQIVKHFQWEFRPKGSDQTIHQGIRLNLDRRRYEYFRRLPRKNGMWNHYAEVEMPEVRDLAVEFQKLYAERHWSTFNQAYNVLKFVQSCIRYSSDAETTGHADWARYPIETLMEENGDCEDVAILCAAIIARMGLSVALILYPNHMAFGVAGAEHLKGEYVKDPRDERCYFYGEATGDGWHLGQIPPAYRDCPPERILPVNILLDEDFPE